MKKYVILWVLIFLSSGLFAQEKDTNYNAIQNLLLQKDSKFVLGGYGEVHLNTPLSYGNSDLDVHRFVFLFGYNFTDRLSVVTELEIEHVKEVFLEQAFVNYNISNGLNLRGGLMLVPFGIINEYHEPTVFNGVERPGLDSDIVPSTWRQIGAGITGNLSDLNLRYQLYIMNGFKSYNGAPTLNPSKPLRSARQKGAEAIIGQPNFSAKIDYFGIQGLKAGFSGYYGQTASTITGDADFTIEEQKATKVNLGMLAADYRYSLGRFESRGEYVYGSMGGVDAYNDFNGTQLGKSFSGFYLELGYDIMPWFLKEVNRNKLIVFSRFENYDTQKKVSENIIKNDAYNRTQWTSGLSYRLGTDFTIKADFTSLKNKSLEKAENYINLGIGVWY